MHINGAIGGSHGYALLIAASAHGRTAAMAATEALPALAAVPPGMLLGTATASVVQLADPDDPHVVLSHLRTAAAHDGPLLLCIAGRLMLDSRQRLPHLALAKSTARTVRYSGLPWHWLLAELQHRPAGTTTLLADLVADGDLWQHAPWTTLTGGQEAYGAVVRQESRRRAGPPASPAYTQAVAALLREATDTARATTGTDGADGTDAGGPAGHAAARPRPEHLHQQAVLRAGLTALDPGRVQLLGGAPPMTPAPAAAPAPAPEPAPVEAPAGAASAPPMPPMPASPPPPPPPTPAAATPAAAAPVGAPEPAAGTSGDLAGLHETIFTAAAAGRHGEASAIAAAWEQTALRTGGPASPDAIHWLEVRAELARLAEDQERSCRLWLQAASARLQNGQDPADAEVSGAVDRAHHCWHQVHGAASARELGLALAELRERSPSARPGALEDVRSRLAALDRTATPGAGDQETRGHRAATGS